jgi:hypothetical protein
MRAVGLASKLLGVACALLTIILWAVTLVTDPSPGPISAAVALSAIVAVVAILTFWK